MLYRILDTIATVEVPELLDSTSLISDGQSFNSSVHTDPEFHHIAAEKYAEYSVVLTPTLELEGKLVHSLHEDDNEDKAACLRDGSTPRLVCSSW